MAHLEQRRNRWYAILTIPKAVRHLLDDRVRFVKSTKTGDKEKAQDRADVLVKGWKAEIQRAKGNVGAEFNPLEWALQAKNELEMIKEPLANEVTYFGAVAAIEKLAPDNVEMVVGVLTGKRTPFDVHVDEWLADLDIAQKTIDQRERDIKMFTAKLHTIEDVTSTAVRDLLNQWVKPEQEGGKEYGVASLKRVLGNVRGYWEYLQEKELVSEAYQPFNLPKSLLKSKQVRENSKRGGKRKPFTGEDLKRLRRASLDKGDDVLADLIILAAYTGARISELCAIKITEASSDVLFISDSKTDAGIRNVPVHSEVKQTVSRLLKVSTDGYLLSGLSNDNQYGDRSAAIGKRFGRLKTQLGYGKEFVFHSTRHTFTTAARSADKTELGYKKVIGHVDTGAGVSDDYTHDLPMERLKEVVEGVSYGINWD